MNDYRSHLSVTVWAALAALALGAVIRLPERVLTTNIFGSAVSLVITVDLLVGLVAVVIVCTGLEAAIRTHPHPETLHHTYRFWGLPAAIAMTASSFITSLPQNALWAVSIGITGIALAGALLAEYHTLDPEDRHFRSARLVLNLLVYATAIAAFVLIYSSRTRSLISATLIGAIAGLLALELLRSDNRSLGATFLYGAVVALVMAQATWVLNYWPHLSLRVGLVLLIGFYLLVGLAQQELWGRLTRRRAAEYLALAALVTVIVAGFRG